MAQINPGGVSLPPIENRSILETIGNLLFFPESTNGASVLQLFLKSFVGLAIGAAGVTAFFYLIIGGYHYITASGDKEATQKSVKTITSALVGLAIVLSVFAIINVFEVLFGIPILIFKIPTIG
jgi:hypothetical protein